MRFTHCCLAVLLVACSTSSNGASPPHGDAGADAAPSDAAAPEAAPAPVVVDPGVISASGASVAEHEPHIAVAKGHVGVAWIARQQPNLFIGYRISTDDGQSWAPIDALPLPADNNIGGDPFLAAGADGTLYVTWGSEQKASGNRTNLHVFVAKAAPGETKFGAPVEVIDPTVMDVGVYDQPKIGVTPAGLVVTYMQANTASTRSVIVSAFSVDGKTWTRTEVAGPGASGSFRNRAILCDSRNTGNRVFMQYLDDVAGTALRWSDDGGKTWPAANQTTVPAADEVPNIDEEIGCAADGNDVWVFYSLSTDTTADGTTTMAKRDALRIAHSSDRGATIDRRISAQDKDAGKYFLMGSFVREEGGGLDVTYYAGNASGDPAGSYRRARSSDGMSFERSTVVHKPMPFQTSRTTLTWIGDYVGLASSGKNLHMAYADTTGAAAHIAYYRVSTP